jgi:Trypsin-like peptidase domain
VERVIDAVRMRQRAVQIEARGVTRGREENVETYRAVEVLVELGAAGASTWLLGSGFVVRPEAVVTAAHNLGDLADEDNPGIWVRDLNGQEWPAIEVLACSAQLDLAMISVPGIGRELEPCRLGRVDRERVFVVPDVVAVGFPGFKEAPEKPKAQRRQSAQADGWIPTAENYSGGELIFKLRQWPPQVTMSSPWQGFSGSGVVAAERLIGVAIEHRPAEGPGVLTVRSLSALAGLPASRRESFAATLGVEDLASLPLVEAEREPAEHPAFTLSEPGLRMRIDRLGRFVRRTRSGTVTFGTASGPDGVLGYGEGAVLQVTLENASLAGEIISAVDVEVREYDPSFTAGYPTIPLPGLHLEVPVSAIEEPLALDELADLDGAVPVLNRQLALDPAGGPTAHHTLNFSVVAISAGLWKLAVRARYATLARPDDVREATSDSFYVVKA